MKDASPPAGLAGSRFANALEAAEYLAREGDRLFAITEQFRFRDAGDTCLQLRIRAEAAVRRERERGSR